MDNAQAGRDLSAAAGKAARSRVPLESHRDFEPASGRDPVGLLLEQAKSRVPELVPVRHGRMLVSPFTFFRGAALPMAADLAATPASGFRAQLCGDAHLSNFGVFGSPERRLVFDVNDFDETLPGPFEWDVKRLVASLVVAGRDNGFAAADARRVAVAAAARYRKAMREFAASPTLEVWYSHLDVEDAIARFKQRLKKRVVKESESMAAKVRTRDSTQAVAKLTRVVDGQREIVANPPLIVPVEELAADANLRHAQVPGRRLRAHPAGGPPAPARPVPADPGGPQGGRGGQRRHPGVDLADGGRGRPRPADAAGQAGRTFGAGRLRRGEPVRQPGRAGGVGPAADAGGQRHLPRLAAHDRARWRPNGLLPAPATGLEVLRADRADGPRGDGGLRRAMRLDAGPGSRAHRDRFAIAAYLGGSEKFEQAVADFGVSYADQTERDHAALSEAAASGRVEARPGV